LGLCAAAAFGGAGADQVELYIGEASEYRHHQPPGAGAGPRFRQGPKLPMASTMRLTMPKRSKVLRASRSIRVAVTFSL
jgi:hypothetical protein